MRRWWPPLAVLAVLLLAGALVLAWIDVLGAPDEPVAAPVTVGAVVTPQSSAVKAELVRRLTSTLEHLPPKQHEGHGGTGTAAAKAVCGVRVYGYEPVTAGTADDVVTVYGFHMCGLAEPGLPWERAMKIVAPMVVSYDDATPTIRMAESGNGVSYRDRVKQLFPASYQRSAFEEALGPAGMTELRDRYDTVAATSTTR